MKILVTGGLGYIGSHVTVLLLEKGITVVSIDNLENARLDVLDGIESITTERPVFECIDVRNRAEVEELFKRHPDFDGIIHFAAYKAVGESVDEPLKYYENNIGGLIEILRVATQNSIPFIFSSSCTVYGQADSLPINEKAPLKEAFSPYGSTKKMGEQIVKDCCQADKEFKAILLRYFNPIGAHPSSKIGEYPQGVPQNLVPFLTQTVAGKRSKLKVFGSNYDTIDGTCVRDYIHVMDLAQAHIDSLSYLIESKNSQNCEVFNVGTGRGVTVLEIIQAFERATGEKVPYELSTPRSGDTVAAYADPNQISERIGWKAQYSLEEALQSAWNWEKTLE
jgi:UDP-glucose 4-epimerase